MRLYVGNGSIKDYNAAIKLFSKIELLDRNTDVDFNKNYHTSKFDLEIDCLKKFIANADEVYTGTLDEYSDIEKIFLGLEPSPTEPIPVHTVNKNDIVFLGCSHTEGIGVSRDARYSAIVSNHFSANEKNLALSGTGVAWASALFHRIEFTPGQTVILQASYPTRFSTLDNNYQIGKMLLNNTNNRDLVNGMTDDILLYQSYSLISNMIYSARIQKLNFKCFMMHNVDNILTARLFLLLKQFNEFFHLEGFDQNPFYDLGTDNLHPGPKTHQYIADELIKNLT